MALENKYNMHYKNFSHLKLELAKSKQLINDKIKENNHPKY